jgi:DNA-binding beta-propeller fold protein YncE
MAVAPTQLRALAGEAWRAARAPLSYRLGSALVIGVAALCVLAVIALLLRPNADPGTRVWILNHAPDQVIIVNPFNGGIEKQFLVADGLRELAFSRDYAKGYVANVVDVTNRLTVLDTKTYLQEDEIVLDGVPQGIGVFPDNRKLAVILGSRTDFMAGGFVVLDLSQQSKADPKKKKLLYRERELRLTHKIAVSDDGDRIYCIDAKSSMLTVYSYAQKQELRKIDLHGAAEQLYYPRAGHYYYVSVLAHQAVYQLDKATDQVQAVYIDNVPDPGRPFNFGRLRYMCVDSAARHLFATNYEMKTVAIWDIGNLNYSRPWQEIPVAGDRGYRWPAMHFLPIKRFKLKGGLDPALKFIPGGMQITVDPHDEYLFVMDDEGGFYIYDMATVLHCPDMSTPEPRRTHWFGHEIEVRDLKVSLPASAPVTRGAAP